MTTTTVITAHTTADAVAVVSHPAGEDELRGESLDHTRSLVIAHVRGLARNAARPLTLTTIDPDGRWWLLVHPDGQIETTEPPAHIDPAPTEAEPADPSEIGSRSDEAGAAAAAVWSSRPVPQVGPIGHHRPTAPAGSAPSAPHSPQTAVNGPHSPSGAPTSPRTPARPAQPAVGPQHQPFAAPVSAATALAAAVPGQPATGGRRSFLSQEISEEPARRGWRRMLRMSPGEAERSERADEAAVSQHWPGPRTIAIVNGKGGAGKTPATILLSAVFARLGGAGVLAWDNNQTRGTLGWRTERGPHEASLNDLLDHSDRLLGTAAQSADLARFVHHQPRDRFDVLRSQPMLLAAQQRLAADAVDHVHAVASKYYRLIVMDSGNDESDPMWLRMIDHADQLVVATTARDEHAEAGALLLEALAARDERSAQLAARSVVIVSQADAHAKPGAAAATAAGFASLARDTATIPYDPGMVAGPLTYTRLQPATQRAWLAAAACAASGL